MDISKRFDRILQLFFMLQSKSVVDIEQLQLRFETSKRTIYRDIKALESARIPITQHGGGSYSIAEGYRIQPSRFTQQEVLSLLIAEKMMQQHQTRFIKEQFESVLIKVKSSLQFQQKTELNNLDEQLLINPGIKTDDYLPDIIDTLLGSVANQKIISINYHKSNETAFKVREIEPVGLFFERDFWYVLAFCLLRSDYRNFRLDRIKKAQLTKVPFTRKHPSLKEMRSDTQKTEFIAITVKADQSFAHFMFFDRDIYGFHKEETINGHIYMHFNCHEHPTAFVRWFLRFVDIAEIIEPISLKEELNTILSNGLKRSLG